MEFRTGIYCKNRTRSFSRNVELYCWGSEPLTFNCEVERFDYCDTASSVLRPLERNRQSRTGRPDRTEKTGQPGHDNKDRIAARGKPVRDVGNMTSGVRQPGQDSLGRATGTEQQRQNSHENSRDKTFRIGQSGL
jgi:hypothetical protein